MGSEMRTWILGVLFAITSISSYAATEVDWLNQQYQTNGSFSGEADLTTPYLGTSEALLYHEYSGGSLTFDNSSARNFIFGEAPDSTEAVARKMLSALTTSTEKAALLDLLLTHKNADGGFGSQVGFSSTPLDTASALKAISGHSNQNTLYTSKAVGYLLGQQRVDGGWGLDNNNSSVPVTSAVLESLSPYIKTYPSVSSALSSARNFLFSRRSANGEWGELFESALATNSLLPVLAETSALQSTKEMLLQSQAEGGSWLNDVYTTAVVARAISAIDSRASENATTPSGSISGTILKSGSSQPIDGVLVRVVEAPGVQALTSGDGYFLIPSLSSGQYTLVAEKQGYSSISKIATLASGAVVSTGNLSMSVLSSSGVFKGRILESNGPPLPGVMVSLAGANTYSIKTDSSGEFELGAVAPGEYALKVEKAGYIAIAGVAQIVSGNVLNLNQSMVKEGAYVDSSPGLLSGSVVDSKTGAPIVGAIFELGEGLFSTSDSDGQININSVPRDSYTATLTAAGYQTLTYSINFPAGADGQLGRLEMYPNSPDESPTAIKVLGQVVDGISGNGVANANVTVTETGVSTVTGADGRFVLEGITTTNFNLAVVADGYQDAAYGIAASGFGEVSLVLNIAPPGDDVEVSHFEGTVTDVITGLPITSANVSVSTSPVVSQSTDAAGHFLLEGINLLSFQISVVAAGYETKSQTITLAAHGNFNVDVQLAPIESDQFDILSVEPVEAAWSANETAILEVQIHNAHGVTQEVTIAAEIFNVEGISVGSAHPYALGTEVIMPTQSFVDGETKTLIIPWETEQFPPGAYQVIVRVVEPQTASASRPLGRILAERSGLFTISESRAISGSFALSPPLSQAGSNVPVKLAAVIRNAGNTPLPDTALVLQIKDPATDDVVYTAQAVSLGVQIGESTPIDFGEWVPSLAGDLLLSVAAADGEVTGQIMTTLYVGDRASGEITVDRSTVPEGTQTVHLKAQLKGVDTRTGESTDPLFLLVKEAVARGGDYVAREGVLWTERNRCAGCHIQAQSVYGLAASMEKADIDLSASVALFNSISSSQQANGTLMDSNTWPIGQTSIHLWGLTTWPDEAFSFRTKFKAGQYLLGRRTETADRSHWVSERLSAGFWWNGTAQTTALVASSFANLITSYERIGAQNLFDYVLQPSVSLGTGDVQDIEISEDGFAYAAKYAGSIDRIDLSTGEGTVAVSGLPANITGLAVALDGSIFVVGNNRQLIRINADGTRDIIFTSQANLRDVDIGPDGLVYVSDHANQIRVYSQAGDSVKTITSSLIKTPEGLAFGEDGNLYIANLNGYNVLQVDSAGTVSVFASGLVMRPSWIGTDRSGNLYVSTLAEADTGFSSPDGLIKVDSQGRVERIQMGNIFRGFAWYDEQIFVANRTTSALNAITTSALDTQALSDMKVQVSRAARWLISSSASANSDNSVEALTMLGLAHARAVIEDADLLSQIDAAVGALDGRLRSRQRADGGWGRITGQTSDPLITALVGLAIDETHPSPSDPVVRNTIQYLLNRQGTDGSWANVNNRLSTRLAATSLVMAYMPKALERLGGIDVDLHMNFPNNIQPSDFSLEATTVNTSAQGVKEYTWTLTGVTGNGRSVEMDLELADMALGETRPVASAAYLEFNNSFSGERLRIDLDVPNVTALSDVSITQLGTDKLQYLANQDVAITATVENAGSVISSGKVEFTIRAEGSEEPLLGLPSVPVTDLAANSSITLDASWNTGSTLAGAYAVTAELFDSMDRPVSKKSTSFKILAPVAIANTRVVTDKPVYQAWDQVYIEGRVINSALNQSLAASLLKISVVGPAEDIVYSGTRSVTELAPGALFDAPFDMNLTDAIAGIYSVQLTLVDAFSHQLLSSSTAEFAVERLALHGLRGNVTAEKRKITTAESNSCSDITLNVGQQPVTALRLEHQLVRVDTQEVISVDGESLAQLPGGSEHPRTHSIPGNTLAPGSYACVLTASADSETSVLASASFEVVPIPYRFDARLRTPLDPHVLILMDGLTGPEPAAGEMSRSLDQQVNTITATLSGLGAVHETVVNTADFAQKLRSGRFNQYLLLAEHGQLSSDTAFELEQSIYSGDGLLLTAPLSIDNPWLIPVAGARVADHIPEPGALALSADDYASVANPLLLAVIDTIQALHVETGAVVDGGFEQLSADWQYEDGFSCRVAPTAPALIRNASGSGRAVTGGFDWALQVTGSDEWRELFAKAVEISGPNHNALPEGREIALTFEVSSETGGAGRIVMTPPLGVQMSLSLEWQPLGDGKWERLFSLSENQKLEESIDLLPLGVGDYSIELLVQVGQAGSYQDIENVSRAFAVVADPTFESIEQLIDNLLADYPRDPWLALAKADIERASQALGVGNTEAARGKLKSAIGWLKKSDTPVSELRHELALRYLKLVRQGL